MAPTIDSLGPQPSKQYALATQLATEQPDLRPGSSAASFVANAAPSDSMEPHPGELTKDLNEANHFYALVPEPPRSAGALTVFGRFLGAGLGDTALLQSLADKVEELTATGAGQKKTGTAVSTHDKETVLKGLNQLTNISAQHEDVRVQTASLLAG